MVCIRARRLPSDHPFNTDARERRARRDIGRQTVNVT
jgi:hypothetical protein